MVADEPIVYVVDDDPSVRQSLALLLNSDGYRTQTFTSADEFLESDRVTAKGPACLVLDVKMPGLSGHHLHHRPWRYPHGGAGREKGCCGFSSQTF